MTREEMKKKIVEVLDENIRCEPYYFINRGIVFEDNLKNIADALIAAGIGDIKRVKFEADHYWSMWQGALIELARAEYRAKVAERALDLCETAYILALNGKQHEGISQQAIMSDLGVHKFFMEQAEKELEEERKDEKG